MHKSESYSILKDYEEKLPDKISFLCESISVGHCKN